MIFENFDFAEFTVSHFPDLLNTNPMLFKSKRTVVSIALLIFKYCERSSTVIGLIMHATGTAASIKAKIISFTKYKMLN